MKSLTKAELKKLNEIEHEDFVLINVLPREKFLKQHIRTSINVSVDAEGFSETVEKVLASKDRKVVVYCASFDCDASSTAVEQLEKAGFKQVYDYEGGTADWFDEAA